ncbi:hypothetical protein M9Y10_034264 [Tritrichomonas musculus]|uniref:C2 NT-type domain-containing protein n=1 Tax=Tritrichomonas musculus TaxID=1915356 RepID=A0ABR2KEG0_9EUKA
MSRVEVNIKNIEELVIPTSDPCQVFVIIQNSERYNSQSSVLYDPSETVTMNESFQVSSRNPLIDSIIFTLFYRTELNKYNPIGTARLEINKLCEANSNDEKLPIFSFSSDTINCGFLNISFTYSPISKNKEEKATNLLQSLKLNSDSSDSFSDSDDIPIRKKKKLRTPAAFRARNYGRLNSAIDADSFKPKIFKKSGRHKKKDVELKERENGPTAASLALLQKNKLLQKSISKLKIDPEKLKLFADYKVCLDNNDEALNKARIEYKAMENGIIRNEISTTTMMSIENCIELTQKLIDQLKKDKPSEKNTTPQQSQNKQAINSNLNQNSPIKKEK